MCAAQSPQHGHRRKTQKLIEELQRLQLVIDEATIELAVKETMADLMTAMVISVGGRRSCPACEYLNAKELEELAIWEAENGETLESWLRWQGCHLMKTVSIGGCGHATMPWQAEARRKGWS